MNRRDDELVTMSFGAHFDELRRRLFRTVFVLAIFFCAAFSFQDHLLRGFVAPHRQAMAPVLERREAQAFAQSCERAARHAAAIPTREYEAETRAAAAYEELLARMDRLRQATGNGAGAEQLALLDQLVALQRGERATGQAAGLQAVGQELKARALAVAQANDFGASAVGEAERGARALHDMLEALEAGGRGAQAEARPSSFGVVEEDLTAARQHLRSLEEGDFQEKATLSVLSYTESFFAAMKVCFLIAAALTLPWLVTEIWLFISGGLYRIERRATLPFIPAALFLLVLGMSFAYFVLVPIGLGFLGTYGPADVIEPNFTLAQYLNLTVALLLAMGLIFQLPLLMTFVCRAGIVGVDFFTRYRRASIIASLVVAAILTPPDVVTMILMGIPLLLLYEIGILCCRFAGRSKRAAAAGATVARAADPA